MAITKNGEEVAVLENDAPNENVTKNDDVAEPQKVIFYPFKKFKQQKTYKLHDRIVIFWFFV